MFGTQKCHLFQNLLFFKGEASTEIVNPIITLLPSVGASHPLSFLFRDQTNIVLLSNTSIKRLSWSGSAFHSRSGSLVSGSLSVRRGAGGRT